MNLSGGLLSLRTQDNGMEKKRVLIVCDSKIMGQINRKEDLLKHLKF